MALFSKNNSCEVQTTAEDMSFESWDDEDTLSLKTKLLRGIYAYGFENPSPIQKKAIIPLVKRRDVIAQAQSGTGKTGAFVIGSLQILDENLHQPQVLVLAHTRELARQIFKVVDSLGNQMDISYQLLVGGTSTEEDRDKLEANNPQIIIGCPGRVHDMIRRKYLSTKHIGLMVLDEADDDIILLLNKITKTNYTEMSQNIIQIMKNIDANDEENLLKLGEAIFLIGSSNEFYSKLYSKLYKDLIEEFPFFASISHNNRQSYPIPF